MFTRYVFPSCSDPLAKGLWMTFKAKKNLLGGKTSCHYACIKQCNRGGELLRESLGVRNPKHCSKSAYQVSLTLLCVY